MKERSFRRGREYPARFHVTGHRGNTRTGLAILSVDGETDSLKVYYDDKYISLLPGEKREIVARVGADSRPGSPVASFLRVSGWNCDTVSVPLAISPGTP